MLSRGSKRDFVPARLFLFLKGAQARRLQIATDAAMGKTRDASGAIKAKKPPKAAAAAAAHKRLPSNPSVSTDWASAAWPVLAGAIALLVLRYAVPWLAYMTPHGIDPEAVRRFSDMPYTPPAKKTPRTRPGGSSGNASRPSKCPTACQGLGCPQGWSVGRSEADECKCVCFPQEQVTPWDLERQDEARRRGGGPGPASGGPAGRAQADRVTAAAEEADQWVAKPAAALPAVAQPEVAQPVAAEGPAASEPPAVGKAMRAEAMPTTDINTAEEQAETETETKMEMGTEPNTASAEAPVEVAEEVAATTAETAEAVAVAIAVSETAQVTTAEAVAAVEAVAAEEAGAAQAAPVTTAVAVEAVGAVEVAVVTSEKFFSGALAEGGGSGSGGGSCGAATCIHT